LRLRQTVVSVRIRLSLEREEKFRMISWPLAPSKPSGDLLSIVLV
jgi:hypothetical protein